MSRHERLYQSCLVPRWIDLHRQITSFDRRDAKSLHEPLWFEWNTQGLPSDVDLLVAAIDIGRLHPFRPDPENFIVAAHIHFVAHG